MLDLCSLRQVAGRRVILERDRIVSHTGRRKVDYSPNILDPPKSWLWGVGSRCILPDSSDRPGNCRYLGSAW